MEQNWTPPHPLQVSLLPENVIGLTRGVALGSVLWARLCQTRSHQDQREAKINAIHPPTNEISSAALCVCARALGRICTRVQLDALVPRVCERAYLVRRVVNIWHFLTAGGVLGSGVESDAYVPRGGGGREIGKGWKQAKRSGREKSLGLLTAVALQNGAIGGEALPCLSLCRFVFSLARVDALLKGIQRERSGGRWERWDGADSVQEWEEGVQRMAAWRQRLGEVQSVYGHAGMKNASLEELHLQELELPFNYCDKSAWGFGEIPLLSQLTRLIN